MRGRALRLAAASLLRVGGFDGAFGFVCLLGVSRGACGSLGAGASSSARGLGLWGGALLRRTLRRCSARGPRRAAWISCSISVRRWGSGSPAESRNRTGAGIPWSRQLQRVLSRSGGGGVYTSSSGVEEVAPGGVRRRDSLLGRGSGILLLRAAGRLTHSALCWWRGACLAQGRGAGFWGRGALYWRRVAGVLACECAALTCEAHYGDGR